MQSLETKHNNLQQENEKLKKLLAVKERDYNVYYNQYQNIAMKYEELKSKFNGTNKTTIKDKNVENSEFINETPFEILRESESLLLTTVATPDVKSEPTGAMVPSVEENCNASVQDLETPMVDLIGTKTIRVIAKARKRPRASDSAKHSVHIVEHTIRTPTQFKCSMCLKNEKDIRYDNIDDYRKHVMKCHPNQLLCDRCPYHSYKNTHVLRHKESVHSPSIKSGGFDCNLCNISYCHAGGLKRHLNLYH